MVPKPFGQKFHLEFNGLAVCLSVDFSKMPFF